MIDTLLNPSYFWRVATHLGSSSLLLPIFAIQALSLWSSQRAAARNWLLALGLTVLLTLVSKFLFMGWGIGSAALDFTGISGHTLLATSILPVFFFLRVGSGASRLRHWGTAFGLLLALGVGLSRLVLGAHSASEVMAGWLAGLAVIAVTLRAVEDVVQPSLLARLSPLLLLLALSATTANLLPTHNWEVRLALKLSGRSKPYLRHQLQEPQQLAQLAGQPPSRFCY